MTHTCKCPLIVLTEARKISPICLAGDQFLVCSLRAAKNNSWCSRMAERGPKRCFISSVLNSVLTSFFRGFLYTYNRERIIVHSIFYVYNNWKENTESDPLWDLFISIVCIVVDLMYLNSNVEGSEEGCFGLKEILNHFISLYLWMSRCIISKCACMRVSVKYEIWDRV